MTERDDDTRKVGYRNPPMAHRFKPGQSGNRRGRPKGAKNAARIFEELLQATISVTENGKRRRITVREAILKRVVTRAAMGDPKSIVIALNEMRLRERQQNTNDKPFDSDANDVLMGLGSSPEDQRRASLVYQQLIKGLGR